MATASNAPAPLITHLRHVAIALPNLAGAVEFYTEVWGLEVSADDSGLSFLAAVGSPERYILRLRQASERRVDLISFGAPSPAAVDTLARQLGSAGVELVSEPGPVATPGGGYGFRCFDCDGRTIEISAEVGTRRHRKVEEREPVPVRLSHVVVNAADADATSDWYRTHLGFQLSDTLGHEQKGTLMHFLRCNQWHHSFAVARSFSGAANLHHVSFETRGIDEFMFATGHARKAGADLFWGPGRHLAGNNTFAYFVDGFGNMVEYTTELETIDEDVWHPQVFDFTKPEVQDQWGTANEPDFAGGGPSPAPDPGLFVAPPV
jgi:catechol 2,3-dioxygenase-like lactoylglutathione lyase family enzyme